MTNKQNVSPMLGVERELLECLEIEFSTAEASQFELGMLVKIRSALGSKASGQEGPMAAGWQFMPMTGRHKEQWLGCKNWSEMDEMKRRGLPVRNLYAAQVAPVAVVMPSHRAMTNRYIHDQEVVGWNACLAEVAKLNGIKP